ncbi:lipid biosynthesis B12-binding/radical SAM protein [Pseudodesulfovibrio thermohalotolerans]|uniref:lipid biosynthesis B12-binding/radical SAM protein n=1 Tax=Pseudodesulfovibrio thermohalotolerans TaxID=2880651 RepID=UPI0024424F7D|nr:lipid biosynthesis B12-binding/radical SAM protein [Pseudodesulfovibrio thermohalotolerans]WFS63857.1 lipid biosynthesis B12-binding/radical SAM protein [Pseudodesulfovibrio thermohalotolerans]
MARVLLISTNTTTEPYPVYPLGMSVIAAALELDGHNVRQFDFLAAGKELEPLAAVLTGFQPDLTGISLRNIDNVDSLSFAENWYLSHVREVAHFLKQDGYTVVVGGPGFSLMPEIILDYLGADFGVVGEGEQKMRRLVHMLEAGDVPPRVMKPEKGLGSKEMITPVRDEAILDFYMKQSGIASVQTKRGCENRCAYCSYPSIEGGWLRPRAVADVVDEIETLYLRNGVDSVFFTDSVFNDSHGYYLELAEALVRKQLPIKWSGFFQPTSVDATTLDLLKRSGLHAMEVGTDAATDETLEAMNKPFSFADVREFNAACVAARIPCAHFVIFGGPGETLETVRQGIANLNALEHCVVFPFSGIRLYRGTPLYAQARRERLVAPADTLLEPKFYFSPFVDPAQLNEMLKKGFAGRRDRIFPPSDGQERMNVLRRFGCRGLLWDTLISFPKESAAPHLCGVSS